MISGSSIAPPPRFKQPRTKAQETEKAYDYSK
jgi:hypothetical protein